MRNPQRFRHYNLIIALIYAASAAAQPVIKSPETAQSKLVTIEGTIFDAFHWEFTEKPNPDDVVVGGQGNVILRTRDRAAESHSGLGMSSHFSFETKPGIYDIEYSNPRWYLPYRRARVRLLAAGRRTVNLYVIPHAGIMNTVHGDYALPDPELSYDEYYPDGIGNGLNLLVQYRARTRSAKGMVYEGPYLSITFDTLTVRAKTCIVTPTAKLLQARDGVSVEFGDIKISGDRADVNPKSRVIKVFIGNDVREYHF